MNIRTNNKPAMTPQKNFRIIYGASNAPASDAIKKTSVERVSSQLLALISLANGFVAKIRFLPSSINEILGNVKLYNPAILSNFW